MKVNLESFNLKSKGWPAIPKPLFEEMMKNEFIEIEETQFNEIVAEGNRIIEEDEAIKALYVKVL